MLPYDRPDRLTKHSATEKIHASEKIIWKPGLRHRPNVVTCFRKRNFFSVYGYRPHVTGVFGDVFNTLLRVETFENGDYSYSCGRTNTEVLNKDEVLPRNSKMLRVDAVFFLNTEKKKDEVG